MLDAGQARVFGCLQENIAKSGFGDQCKQQVQERESGMQEDYRLDYGVASQCEADVNQYCSLEKVCGLMCCPMHCMQDLLHNLHQPVCAGNYSMAQTACVKSSKLDLADLSALGIMLPYHASAFEKPDSHADLLQDAFSYVACVLSVKVPCIAIVAAQSVFLLSGQVRSGQV